MGITTTQGQSNSYTRIAAAQSHQLNASVGFRCQIRSCPYELHPSCCSSKPLALLFQGSEHRVTYVVTVDCSKEQLCVLWEPSRLAAPSLE
eukprot:2859186-Amphidinium_carterae.1